VQTGETTDDVSYLLAVFASGICEQSHRYVINCDVAPCGRQELFNKPIPIPVKTPKPGCSFICFSLCIC